MHCEQFTLLLGDFIDGELAQGVMALCEEHLAVCRECDAYRASYEGTLRLARRVLRDDRPMARADAAEALIARVLDRTVLRNEPG